MADTDFFDTLLKPHLNTNGTSGLFYQPIKPTGDLIAASKLKRRNGERLSELHIAPPSTRLGSLPTVILDRLNASLILVGAPGADEIVRKEIEDLLSAYGGGNPAARNVLQAALEQKELTGVLNAAARKLNHARLDPVDRAMLSRPNIAMYAFFRAAIGMQVSDIDGIITNVLSSLGKVRSYVNRRLVSEVLDRSNLQADPVEVRTLQDRLAGRTLSFEGDEATRTILDEYRHVKGNAELIDAVNTFLSSGIVAVPDAVNRDHLVREMISYLGRSGFNARAILGLNASFASTTDGLQVRFEDRSVDDGRVTAWSWDFGDGNTSNIRNPAHTYAATGEFVVTLRVSDDDGNEESTSRMVTVAPASSGTSVGIEYQTSHLRVEVRAKPSNGTRIVEHNWDFGDGSRSNEAEPTHTYAREGAYIISVNVRDEKGVTASANQQLHVTKPPEPPRARFTTRPKGLTVSLNDCSEGRIVSRVWRFGDGATSTEKDPVHTYAEGGRYAVELTVKGPTGLTDTAQEELELSHPDGPIIIYGTVVGADEQGMGGIVVRAFHDKTQLGRDARTGTEGRFAIRYKGGKMTSGKPVTLKIFDKEGQQELGNYALKKKGDRLDMGMIQIETVTKEHKKGSGSETALSTSES